MANEITGLLGSSDGGNTLSVGPGTADDSTNTTTITIPAGQTRAVDVTTSGVGGLDTGTIAANTMYALYVLKNQAGSVGAIISLNFTSFSWPNAKFRRVGAVLTNANSQVVAFDQTGPNALRQTSYNASPNVLKVLNGASAASWTDFDLYPPKPNTNGEACLEVTPSGGATYLRTDEGGATITITAPTTLGYTPPIGSNKGSFRTATGASTTVRVVGFSETV
jgi:hypothetical protein